MGLSRKLCRDMAEPRVLLELDGDPHHATAEVVPSVGALVTRLSLGGRELLYLDDATRAAIDAEPGSPDASAPKRGGIPVLFPSPGRLKADLFEAEGRYGSLKNHGFARDLPFSVVARERSKVTMRLESNDETLAHFPWKFSLEIALSLEPTALVYHVTVKNEDAETMPCGFGLHPYFAVRDKAGARARTLATHAWDNKTKRHVDVPQPVDFGGPEVDLHLLDHWPRHLDLDAEGATVRVTASDAFRTWVLWTLPERAFVCVEPWTSPADALNTKRDLLVLAPGETREMTVSIGLAKGA